jgi:hypothetical protein
MPKGVELVCPQCKGSFEQRLLCPRCGVRLYAPEAFLGSSQPELAPPPTPWIQAPWTRLVIGLVLAQGLYYGLLQLCQSLLKVAADEPTFWSTLTPVVIKQGLQVVGLLVGATLAGSGQRWGFVYGCIVGVVNGLLFSLVQLLRGGVPSATEHVVELYGQPIVHAAFGILGGFIGSQIWKPPPVLGTASPKATPARLPELTSRRRPSPLAGPIAWERVLIGVIIAVCGTVAANHIRDVVVEAMVQATGAKQGMSIRMQAEFLSWEISVLAVLFGSGWAGATRPNGMKQGLVVGVISAAVLFGTYLYLGGQKPPEVSLGFVLAGIHLKGLSIHMEHFLFTVINVLALGLVGGWFGGQLLPPVVAPSRRKETGPI